MHIYLEDAKQVRQIYNLIHWQPTFQILKENLFCKKLLLRWISEEKLKYKIQVYLLFTHKMDSLNFLLSQLYRS